jgi:hypothetical protein
VWSGNDYGGGNFFKTGGRYALAGDNWQPMGLTGVPATHIFATAVWTGHRMLIRGGRCMEYFTEVFAYTPRQHHVSLSEALTK